MEKRHWTPLLGKKCFHLIEALPRKHKRWRYNTCYLFVQREINTVHINTMGGKVTIFRQEETKTVMKGKRCIRIATNQEKINIYLTYQWGNNKNICIAEKNLMMDISGRSMPFKWQKTKSNSNFDICSHCATCKMVEITENCRLRCKCNRRYVENIWFPQYMYLHFY